jgi:flagellar biosynthesis protein FliR
MDELVPVILGAILGAVIWLTTSGKTRLVLSLLAVMVSGIIATVASGEYHESWIYLLLDFGEAALGLVVGYVVAARLLAPRAAGHAARRGVDTP